MVLICPNTFGVEERQVIRFTQGIDLKMSVMERQALVEFWRGGRPTKLRRCWLLKRRPKEDKVFL